jgi:hypothetical protein
MNDEDGVLDSADLGEEILSDVTCLGTHRLSACQRIGSPQLT